MNLIKKKKFYLIAEIGNNHEGSIENAIKLVKAAKKSGADAVKFQTFIADDYIHNKQIERYKRLKKFQLKFSEFLFLKKLTHKLKLNFISTPLDKKSAKFISTISDAVKIASGDNDNIQLINECLKNCKSMILSTGFANIDQINKVYKNIKFLKGNSFIKNKFSLLHCTSSYPTKIIDTNLKAINTMQKNFDCEIGLSDHTIDYQSCIYAAFMGVKIFEKHFTLDNNFSNFIDHKVSLNPENFYLLYKKMLETQKILGTGIKKCHKSEENFLKNSKRSLIAKINLKKGQILKDEYFKVLRPMYSNSADININIKNKRILKDLKKDFHLSKNHIKI